MNKLFVFISFIGFSVFVVPGGMAAACTPDCQSKQCGDDGCGGSCGTCEAPAKCVVGHCVKGCGGISSFGSCCYKGFAVYCSQHDDYKGNHIKISYTWGVDDCGSTDNCRWNDNLVDYECDPTLSDYEDPSGQIPRTCDFNCVPQCKNRECGPDGCGDVCGHCKAGEICTGKHKCCMPHCDGKECGPDGCGGYCGSCDPWSSCVDDRCVHYYGCKSTPVPKCPDCACEACVCAKDSGCCYLYWDQECVKECRDECGGCKRCVPDCAGKECGSDGCDAQCGQCQAGDTCQDGKCVKCVPDCTGKECGSNGCGGSCGFCALDQVCDKGKCRACRPGCPAAAECGLDECHNICGEGGCDEGNCKGNYCVSCEPYCANRECGDNHCGGSCGKCGKCSQCISHKCKAIPDCVAPDQGLEPVPDIAEDVHVTKDVVEVKDPGKVGDPGKETVSDTPLATDTTKPDAAGPAPKSGGNCTTGTGTGTGIYLILLLIFGLFARRRRPDIR